MNEPVPKFILVVTGNSVDDAFFDRLRQHTRTLKGTSLTHRVLPEQSDPGSPRPPEPPAPVIVEWFAAAPPNRAIGRERSSSMKNDWSGTTSPKRCGGSGPELAMDRPRESPTSAASDAPRDSPWSSSSSTGPRCTDL